MSLIPLDNYSERCFQLWEYHVSHGRMLIRSPKSQNSKNIDLIFAGVEFVSIPRLLKGLRLDKPTAEDIEYVADALGKPIAPSKVIVLLSSNKRYYVVASGIMVDETNCDIFESPFAKL